MRHAKSDYPAGVADHDRPLNARGRRDAGVAGEWLSDHAGRLVIGDLTVLVSSAERAQQTWAIAGRGLPARVSTEPRVYEASVSTVIDLAATQASGTVLIVGHNPTLEQCVRHLAQRADDVVMKTCAIAVLELDDSGSWGSGSAVLSELHTPRADRQA